MNIQSMLSKINRVLAILLLVSGLFLGTLTYNVSSSYAVTNQYLAVNSTRAEGMVDQVKGKAQEKAGTVQKKFGDDLEDNIEGTTKQVKGRAKQDIGRAKRGVEEAKSNVEETSDNVVDAVKDFFGS
ncbi:CsbD family protein [Cyanothece sp. BG0011]|uniref:CsbD family protein n=1 Tax=Cyanothece sp. BG0011 TaxID=2082950 RepID=UPI000D1F19A1|nr:CsbD family protein [Cyanothece sp. BG0011]